MLIVGYSMGIRSERRLCEEVHLKSRLSLVLPARLRESDALRRLFESVVQRCIAEGIVSADGFAQRDQPCREEACKPPQLSPSRMPEFTAVSRNPNAPPTPRKGGGQRATGSLHGRSDRRSFPAASSLRDKSKARR